LQVADAAAARGSGVSAVGDGISTVTVAWLAVHIAPPESLGLLVGLAVVAYTVPGVIGEIELPMIAILGSSTRSASRRPPPYLTWRWTMRHPVHAPAQPRLAH
jgi:hypothetical protein